jgi:ribosomal protein S18 acetylase RimI-like enzyme
MKLEHRSPAIFEYKTLREAVGWWDVAEAAAEAALGNALFSVVAIEKGQLVGLGRVVGDGGLYFYIQDLIIHPEFQEKGFGKQVMGALMAFIKTKAKSGAFIGLMAAKGLEGYYEPFGFTARDEDAPGMYQIIE